MEEKTSNRENKDTDEIVQWRTIIQEETNHRWKELFGTMEEEVLEKYKVEETVKGAYKGRDEPSEWRIVQGVKKYQPREWGEGCWARVFSWFRGNTFQ